MSPGFVQVNESQSNEQATDSDLKISVVEETKKEETEMNQSKVFRLFLDK